MISGLLLALSLPKPGIWLLAWVGLVPLLLALRGAGSRRAALYGLITGIVYFGIILFPISLFGYLPWALLIVFQSLYLAAFAFIASAFFASSLDWRSIVGVPAAWTGVQWVRSLGTYALPWGSLAHTQANNLVVAQLASITGPWGIDFLVCLVNVALVALLARPKPQDRRRALPAAVAFVILATVCGWGYSAMKSPISGGPRVKVAIIQGNMPNSAESIPDYDSEAFVRYARMSLKAARAAPELIVWPETAIPAVISRSEYAPAFCRLARFTHANCLVGAYDAPRNSKLTGDYNSAFLFGKNGSELGVYHKVHLVPFGEFVPLRRYLPFLASYEVRDLDVLPGRRHALLADEAGKLGVSICFESLFPQISRIETRNGANLLVVITDDAWFEKTQTARLHMMAAKLRAIECRRYLLRGADSGISAVIDPYGRTLGELGIFRRGIVRGEVRMMHTQTPYVRFGDYFAYACALATAVLAFLLRNPKQKKVQADPEE